MANLLFQLPFFSNLWHQLTKNIYILSNGQDLSQDIVPGKISLKVSISIADLAKILKGDLSLLNE